MNNKKLIEKLTELKKNATATALGTIDKIQEALSKFDGKSITGNKKKITDAIRALQDGLYIDIEKDAWSGAALKIYFYARNTHAEVDRFYGNIKSEFYILYLTNKENILRLEDVKAILSKTKESLQETLAELENTTPEKIQELQQKKAELLSQLQKLHEGTDKEILEIAGYGDTWYR